MTAVSEINGVTAYWDKGLELAVTDKRQIRLVSPEEELKLFGGAPCSQLGDSQAEWDNRREENAWYPQWRASPSRRAACGR